MSLQLGVIRRPQIADPWSRTRVKFDVHVLGFGGHLEYDLEHSAFADALRKRHLETINDGQVCICEVDSERNFVEFVDLFDG